MPSYRIIPLTVGANYVVSVGRIAFYAAAGAGYYFAKAAFTATAQFNLELSGDMNVNEPGFYVGGGFRYRVGKFAFDVGTRFNYIENEGTYDVDMEYDIATFHRSVTFDVVKGFNDSFVDVLAGVNYYFM